MRIKRIKEKADIFTSAFSNNTQSSERTIKTLPVLFCDWQAKIFIFLIVYLTGSGSAHFFLGSASNVSGSVMTIVCKFLTSINLSCLHFRQ